MSASRAPISYRRFDEVILRTLEPLFVLEAKNFGLSECLNVGVLAENPQRKRWLV